MNVVYYTFCTRCCYSRFYCISFFIPENLWYIYPLVARFMGPTRGPSWDRQDPGGPHVGPMNFAIWVIILHSSFTGTGAIAVIEPCWTWVKSIWNQKICWTKLTTNKSYFTTTKRTKTLTNSILLRIFRNYNFILQFLPWKISSIQNAVYLLTQINVIIAYGFSFVE